jgi:hypothetical protein
LKASQFGLKTATTTTATTTTATTTTTTTTTGASTKDQHGPCLSGKSVGLEKEEKLLNFGRKIFPRILNF